MPDLAFHRKRFPVPDQVALSLIDVGRGDPLVILPAWSNAAICYSDQIVDLSTDWRVVAIDMRGHGESEKTEHGYRVSRLAADLYAVLEQLDLRNATLLGHSLGCSVIWSYIDLFGSERISRLLLVDQAPTQLVQPHWTQAERLDFGAIDTAESLFSFCEKLRGDSGWQTRRDLFAGLFTAEFPADRVELICREIDKMPLEHAADLMLDHATRDWRDVIRQIQLPTLVIGARLSVFPVQSQAWIAGLIPGADLKIFEADEGGSHFMCFENPRLFNRYVREFIVSVGRS
ncbi:alpha/beta hydrolase [Nostoc sp. NIES-2111]